MTPAEAEKMCNPRDDTCHGCDLWPEEDDDPDPQAIAWAAYCKAFGEAMAPRFVVRNCRASNMRCEGIVIE